MENKIAVQAVAQALAAQDEVLGGLEGDAETKLWHLLVSMYEYAASKGIDLETVIVEARAGLASGELNAPAWESLTHQPNTYTPGSLRQGPCPTSESSIALERYAKELSSSFSIEELIDSHRVLRGAFSKCDAERKKGRASQNASRVASVSEQDAVTPTQNMATPEFEVAPFGGLHCLFLRGLEGPYLWGFSSLDEADSFKLALNRSLHSAGCLAPVR